MADAIVPGQFAGMLTDNTGGEKII